MLDFMLNPNVHISPSSDCSGQYYAQIDEKQYLLSAWVHSIVYLSCNSDNSPTIEKIAKEVGKSADEVENVIQYLLAYEIIQPRSGCFTNVVYSVNEDSHILHNMASLSSKHTLLKKAVTEKIGKLFSPLFNNTIMLLIIVPFLVILPISVISSINNFGFFLNPSVTLHYSFLCLPLILLLNAISGFLHESGHLGACSHCGGTPGEVGIGIYLTSIVLYSNVKSANFKNKTDKVKVDAGGIVADIFLLDILLTICLISKNIYLFTASFALVFKCFENFDPFKKTDGYWIVSDLFNIPNLHIRLEEWLLKHEKNYAKSKIMPMYFSYCLLIILAYLVGAVYFLPRYVMEYPILASSYWNNMVGALAKGNVLDVFLNFYFLLALLIPLVGVVIMIKKAIKLLNNRINRRCRK